MRAVAAPVRALLAILVLSGCGLEAGEAAVDPQGSCAGNAPCLAACGEPVAFDPHGAVITAHAADACVRLERVPTESRRGTVWSATRLAVFVFGLIDVDSDAPAYQSSHHNCQDEASATGVRVLVDGAEPDPSVCFGGDPSAWRLRIFDGATERSLAPD